MVKILTLKQRYADYLKAPRRKGSKILSFNEWRKKDRKFLEGMVAAARQGLKEMNLE